MQNKIKFFLKSFLFLLFFFFLQVAQAQQTTIVDEYKGECTPNSCSGTVSDTCKNYCGDYDNLDSMLSLIVKITNIILEVVGSLALLAFIYGGVVFLTSAGSREKVEKGKQIIIGSIIGLVVVFVSYTIVGFVYAALGVTGDFNILGGVL